MGDFANSNQIHSKIYYLKIEASNKKFSMAKIQKILNFILLVAVCYQKPAIAANKTSFFPSSNSSLLEVTSDILIDVYDGPDIKTANKIGNVSLSKNEQT